METARENKSDNDDIFDALKEAERQMEMLWKQRKMMQRGHDDEEEEDEQGVIMKECRECGGLMLWDTGPYQDRRCTACGTVYEEAPEYDYRGGYDEDGVPETHAGGQQGGTMGLEAERDRVDATRIGAGRGAGRLQRAQRFTAYRQNFEKLLATYGRLVTDTLDVMGISANPEAARATVLQEFEQFYTRKPKRMLVRDVIAVLAISLHNYLLRAARRTGVRHGKDALAATMQRIYDDRDYRRRKQGGGPGTEGGKKDLPSMSKASKMQQRIASSDAVLKRASNMTSVLSISKDQKSFISAHLHDLDGTSLDYISGTFDEMQLAVGPALKRTTAKTVNPLFLALACKRHGLVTGHGTEDLSLLKKTSQKHIATVLEKSIFIYRRGQKPLSLGSFLLSAKVGTTTNDDAAEAAMTEFHDFVGRHAARVKTLVVDQWKNKQSNKSNKSEKGQETQDSIIPKIMAVVTSLLAQDPGFAARRDSFPAHWAKLSDPDAITKAVESLRITKHTQARLELTRELEAASVALDMAALVRALRRIRTSRDEDDKRTTKKNKKNKEEIVASLQEALGLDQDLSAAVYGMYRELVKTGRSNNA
jgi:hypothetical protein